MVAKWLRYGKEDSEMDKRAITLIAVLLFVGGLCVEPAVAHFEQVITGGLGNQYEVAVVGSAMFNDRLYVGTLNKENGCVVYRIIHKNGKWKAKSVSAPGFGEPVPENNFTTSQFMVFDHQLYVGTWNEVTGAQLWRTKEGVTVPHGQNDWERVDYESFGGKCVTSMAVLDGYLYAGIFTLKPCKVWRSLDGLSWEQINVDGFGKRGNSDATTMAVFKDFLFVGTENGYGPLPGTGTQIWCTDGETGDPDDPTLLLWRWVTRTLGGGFGSGRLQHNTMNLIEYDDLLWAGTFSLTQRPQLWKFDGRSWEEEYFYPGFLEQGNRAFTFHSAFVMDGSLYLGTQKEENGGDIIRYDGKHWSVINREGFGNEWNVVVGIAGEVDDYLVCVTANAMDGCSVWVIEPSGPGDLDCDGVAHSSDNCVSMSNADQLDSDKDRIGDRCDNCPSVYNPDQSDRDLDGIGDACE
jgi:hypothetical protein